MNAAVKAQLLAHGAKLPKDTPNLAPTAPKPPQRVDTGGTGREAARGAEWAPTNKPEQYYAGPYALQVANGTHYPGRARYVVTGPASEELTAALVAALHQFTSKP
jgi:hypothetical protein